MPNHGMIPFERLRSLVHCLHQTCWVLAERPFDCSIFLKMTEICWRYLCRDSILFVCLEARGLYLASVFEKLWTVLVVGCAARHSLPPTPG